MVDLPRGEAPLVGPGDDSVVRIDGLARAQGSVRWDGEQLTLERTAKNPPIYINGKRLQSRALLRPGDELSVGDARMVVGLASQAQPSGRRALTHQEFRERLAEELARAARRGRPTALVMVQARSGEGARVLEAALAFFRAGDVVATYAHDEIELLLPDTSGEQARAVVTRVLEGTGLSGLAAGLAVAPNDADTPRAPAPGRAPRPRGRPRGRPPGGRPAPGRAAAAGERRDPRSGHPRARGAPARARRRRRARAAHRRGLERQGRLRADPAR
ncbi:MAG: GGDEF domain-containing protein [Sandaracinaceae bacterium]|nr:GGDEF domain-containing protein [Sandaracinaceae bacterium]